MKNTLLITFLTLTTTSFLTTSFTKVTEAQYNTSASFNETQLLAHLKEVKTNLQEIIQYQQNLDKEIYQGEKEWILLSTLYEDFYNNSAILQTKLSELVTPTFDLICTHMATVDNISVDMFQPYNESIFDKNTTAQLHALFKSIYNKSGAIKTYCDHYPSSDLAQTSIDELFEDALDIIIYNDGMLTYETKALLKRIEAKIAELA
jgi:hypothetical protein